jgi:hypothetical protein
MMNGDTSSDHGRWRRPQRAGVLAVTADVVAPPHRCRPGRNVPRY